MPVTSRSRTLLAVACVLVSQVVIAVLVDRTDLIGQVKRGFKPASPREYVLETMEYHRRADPHVPPGAVVFMGDSIVQSLATSAVAPYAVNYGIGTQTTAALLDHLAIYATSLQRASAVVFSIGVNDVANGRAAGLPERYRLLIDAVPPQTPVVVSAIGPVIRGVNAVEMTGEIGRVNQTLKEMCARRAACRYVDTWALFAGRENGFNPRYFMADGLHLSRQGYNAWIGALRTALQDVPTPAPR
ncbi:MAG: hypothetical protein EOP92_16160 [Lysobacteraceae bacterium]|nr:MAG: hypothetical protein EOP92_16160 [Xanthomonadaceae bacterium]